MQLPLSFLDSLEGLPGYDRSEFIAVHEKVENVTSIRINPVKVPAYATALENSFSFKLSEKVPWCRHAFYLEARPVFALDPLWHAGGFYVQEASSLFLDWVLKQIQHLLPAQVRILDLCAAPGGKTTLLETFENALLVLSNEVIKSRVPVLYENVVKWGSPTVLITNNDPRDFSMLTGFFDVMMVDAPCSGSGLFRKNPEAIKEWSANHVMHCAERQRRILSDALPALSEGGFLVYSTCSYSHEENEGIIDWLCDRCHMKSVKLELPADCGIIPSQSEKNGAEGYRFYPNRLKGEGFFIACLQKTEGVGEAFVESGRFDRNGKNDLSFLKNWLQPGLELCFLSEEVECLAIPNSIAGDYLQLKSLLKFRKSGTRVGRLMGRELIPDHELALSTMIAPGLPFVELDYPQSLQYLRRNPFSFPDMAKGWILVRYKGVNLGWVKSLGNRVNNYYPLAWRLLKL